MSRVNANQVGGDHYRSDYQHWDLIERHGIGYLEGCATKYVTRWRKKNGVQDLEKALHYVEKLIELHDCPLIQKPRCHRGIVPVDEINRYSMANSLNGQEQSIILYLTGPWNLSCLHNAAADIRILMREAQS